MHSELEKGGTAMIMITASNEAIIMNNQFKLVKQQIQQIHHYPFNQKMNE
jgi:hypothetical protein